MKHLKFLLPLLCVVLLFSGQAYALLITPSDPIPILTGPETSQTAIDAIIAGIVGEELYKQDVGGGESFALAGSYETTFNNSPTDPADADISYIGGDIVGPTAHLLVKDGDQTPAWYLFDLTAAGWDGMEILQLRDFWPRQGAISHVSLYGESTSVPEPATMLLLGTGLIGLAGLGRRKFRK